MWPTGIVDFVSKVPTTKNAVSEGNLGHALSAREREHEERQREARK